MLETKKSVRLGVGYVRTSSTTNPKESIPNQKNAIQQYCIQNGILLQDILIDACLTGVLSNNRDNFLKLKSLVKHKAIEVVVVYFSSRLGRTSDDWILLVEEMRNNGIEFISISEGLVGSKMNILQVASTGVLVEYENRNRRKFCDDGLRHARAMGKFAFASPPFGYIKDENKYLILNEQEAEQVRMIFDKALQGLRPSEIARRLNELCIRKPLGREWHGSHIMKILKNPTYTGIIYHQKEMVKEPYSTERIRTPGVPASTRKHPAIVSEEEFRKVNELLHTRPIIHKTPKFHLLSRVLYCPECGTTMIANARKNAYECKERKTGKSRCPLLYKEEIESKVLEYLIRKEENPNQLMHVKALLDEEKMREGILDARKKLNMKYVNLQLSAEDYQRKIQALNAKLQEITLQSKKSDMVNMDYNRYIHLIDQKDYKALNQKLRKERIKFSLNPNKEVIEITNTSIILSENI